MEISLDDLKNSQIKELENYYKICEKVGTGAFGTVYKGYEISTGRIVAIKEINPDKQGYNQALIDEEMKMLKSLDNPHIVRFYNYLQEQNVSYIIMEYLAGGTLKDYINKNEEVTEEDVSIIIKQLLLALSHLHYTCDICHRDIKPDNIMFENQNDINSLKVLDFGLSKGCFEFQEVVENCGTLSYMAPEQINKISYSKAVDLWSVGIITYMMLHNGKNPFCTKGDSRQDVIDKICTKVIDFHQDKYPLSSMAKHFINKLLCKNPSYRYTARQALRHPWITRNKFDNFPLTIYDKYLKNDYVNKLKSMMQVAIFMKYFKKENDKEKEREKEKEKEKYLKHHKQSDKDKNKSNSIGSGSDTTLNTEEMINTKDTFDMVKYEEMVIQTNNDCEQKFKAKRLCMFDPQMDLKDSLEIFRRIRENINNETISNIKPNRLQELTKTPTTKKSKEIIKKNRKNKRNNHVNNNNNIICKNIGEVNYINDNNLFRATTKNLSNNKNSSSNLNIPQLLDNEDKFSLENIRRNLNMKKSMDKLRTNHQRLSKSKCSIESRDKDTLSHKDSKGELVSLAEASEDFKKNLRTFRKNEGLKSSAKKYDKKLVSIKVQKSEKKLVIKHLNKMNIDKCLIDLGNEHHLKIKSIFNLIKDPLKIKEEIKSNYGSNNSKNYNHFSNTNLKRIISKPNKIRNMLGELRPKKLFDKSNESIQKI